MKRGRSENKPERKTIEKNRRNEMKALCCELVSFIPDHHLTMPKDYLSQQVQLEQSVAYIKILRERIEELRIKKTQALMNTNPTNYGTKNIIGESKFPILKINAQGSAMEVNLISRPHKTVMLHQIISLIEQEGAEVLSVSISNVGDKIFHNLHAQDKDSGPGMDISKISEKIHELIF